MGTRAGPLHVLEWQRSLGAMRRHGVRLMLTGCRHWRRVDLEALAAELGDEASLWDASRPCPVCRKPQTFMASPGQGTPFLPLVTPSGRRALGR